MADSIYALDLFVETGPHMLDGTSSPISVATHVAKGSANRFTLRRGWNYLGTNRCYFFSVFVSFLLLLFVAIWPVIRNTVEHRTGYDCAPTLGMSQIKPWYRGTMFRFTLVSSIMGMVYYGVCFRTRRMRALRGLALAGAGLYYLGLILANNHLIREQILIAERDADRLIHEQILIAEREGNLIREQLLIAERTSDYEQQWSNFQRLKIVDCENAHVDAIQIREEIRMKEITSFKDFHRCVMDHYVQAKPRLKKRWSAVADKDEIKMKTLFIMNFVSGLWSFGNRTAVTKPGCAFVNEQNQWQSPPETLSSYLESEIGCCCDFAYVTKSLLDQEGIENRLTSTVVPAHIFNEVRIGADWCIVDATINVFVDCSWEDLYKDEPESDSVVVLVFPHSNLADMRSVRYRSLAGHFRLMTLTRFANCPSNLRSTLHPKMPSYFAEK